MYEETASQPRHGLGRAGAAFPSLEKFLRRVTRFAVGEQRIERLVVLRAAQPFGHGLVAQHPRHAGERLQMVGPRVERREEDEQQVDRKPVDRLEIDRPRELERSEEHTSELQSLMRISYAVFCLKKKKRKKKKL